MVFPELARSGVAMVELVGEFEVEFGYSCGKDGGAGAVADVHQLERVAMLVRYVLDESLEGL